MALANLAANRREVPDFPVFSIFEEGDDDTINARSATYRCFVWRMVSAPDGSMSVSIDEAMIPPRTLWDAAGRP